MADKYKGPVEWPAHDLTRRIGAALAPYLERDGLVLAASGGRRRLVALCPFHSEHTPSFTVWADEGNWYCFGCAQGGDAVDYVALRYGLDQTRSFKQILGLLGLAPPQLPRPALRPKAAPLPAEAQPSDTPLMETARYDYTLADGTPVYQVRRYTPKTFRQYHFVDGEWQKGRGGTPDLLYYLPDVLAAVARGATILLLEGEKDVQLAWQLGFAATCNSGGAGRWPHEPGRQTLAGASVVIIPDNDEPGRRHAQDVAAGLHGVAASVAILQLPELVEHGDLSDWFDGGHQADELTALLAQAEPWRGLALAARPTPPPMEGPKGRETDVISVQVQAVRWLWPGYVPFGAVTVLDGDPGLGKSMVTLDLAARASNGVPMPLAGPLAHLAAPMGVLLLSCENDIASVVRPRLEAAGANVLRVMTLDVVEDDGVARPPTLLDVAAIAEVVQRRAIKLLIIDPLMAYLPGEVNAFRDQDVRRAFAPLSALAAELGLAVIVVRHLNKKTEGSSALYRGGGSIGIIGAARMGLLVAPDPADTTGERRILAVSKNNLGLMAPALAYSIVAAGSSARIDWHGPVALTADTLLNSAPAPQAQDSAFDRACAWLREQLAAGPRLSSEITTLAAQEGIAPRTLVRAREQLGVKSGRVGDVWSLWLPPLADGPQQTSAT